MSVYRSRDVFPRVLFVIVVSTIALATGVSSSYAQFTLLNQFANGPVNSPGYVQMPLYVSNVGPNGQIVVTQGVPDDSNVANTYAADGTYLQTALSSKTLGGGYSNIGPDGTYYVSVNNSEDVAVINSGGGFVRDLPSSGGIVDPTGVVTSTSGSLYVGNSSTIQVYSTAFDGTTYPSLGSFGSVGSGPGQFGVAGVGAMALDSTSANLYATDSSNHRVEVFSAGGSYESSIGDASGPGQLNTPEGVAVSNTGLVYVADIAAGIKVFSTTGTYLETVAATINGQPFDAVTVSVAPTGMVYAGGQQSGGGGVSDGAFRFFDPASWSWNEYIYQCQYRPDERRSGNWSITGNKSDAGCQQGSDRRPDDNGQQWRLADTGRGHFEYQ